MSVYINDLNFRFGLFKFECMILSLCLIDYGEFFFMLWKEIGLICLLKIMCGNDLKMFLLMKL